MRPLLIVSCSVMVFLAPTLAPGADQANPFDTPEGVQQGSALFQTHCTYCHGARGQGGRGSDLTTGQYKYGGPGARLHAPIPNRVRGTELPPARVGDEEGWQLCAVVKKL